jgi:hypothetical protein
MMNAVEHLPGFGVLGRTPGHSHPPIRRAGLLSELRSALFCIAYVLPVGLVAVPGTPRVFGVIYSFIYGLALVPSTAAYLSLFIDSVLLLRGKRPIILTAVIHEMLTKHDHRPRVNAAYSWLGDWSYEANPLGPVVLQVFALTCWWRHDAIRALTQEIANALEAERSRPETSSVMIFEIAMAPQVVIPRRLLKRLEPELTFA